MRHRIATLVAIALVLAASLVLARRLHPDRASQHARPGVGEVSVNDAFVGQPDKAVVVRGYAFTGAGFPLRLCDGRTATRPPRCVGPFFRLAGVIDEGQLPLTRAKGVAYSEETVALLGTLRGDEFTVSQIVQ